MSDITLRALDILRSVDWIAAEDTRHTQPLLRHHGIDARLLSVHTHNETTIAEKIISKLAAGESIALVSDAGTPAISDPGSRLVACVRAAGYPVIPIPGPSAVTAALSVAGLTDGRFYFHGFLPPARAARQKILKELYQSPYNLVFYEAPHRILETLTDMCEIIGPTRQIVVAKEITKLFEHILHGPLNEAIEWLTEDPRRQKGEFVLIIEAPVCSENDLIDESTRVLKVLLNDGLTVKQATELTVKIAGGQRKNLYRQALALQQEDN